MRYVLRGEPTLSVFKAYLRMEEEVAYAARGVEFVKLKEHRCGCLVGRLTLFATTLLLITILLLTTIRLRCLPHLPIAPLMRRCQCEDAMTKLAQLRGRRLAGELST